MKYTVAALEGALLDAAVAQAEGMEWMVRPASTTEDRVCAARLGGLWELPWSPSTSWAFGGQIIERERITVVRMHRIDEQGLRHAAFFAWVLADAAGDDGAGTYFDVTPDQADGEGPEYLIAAMRAYVASRLGEEVDLP